MDTDDSLPKNKGGRPAGLTTRQREFAKFYVDGRWSNAECARKAGYADGSAAQHAAKLLDGRSFPDVPELIKELREARERKYGVTLMNQLKRFDELSRSAEEAGQFSAAINAEKIRSSLGGLTIDRRESTHVHQLDNMSREDIVARLSAIRKEYPSYTVPLRVMYIYLTVVLRSSCKDRGSRICGLRLDGVVMYDLRPWHCAPAP
jgi:hypothetical protein